MSSRGPRSFDPVRLGNFETDAWAAYYRRDWRRFLRAAYRMVAEGFGLGPFGTTVGAWHVLRANQHWAPYPDNDPDAARRSMRRFYALVMHTGGFDPGRGSLSSGLLRDALRAPELRCPQSSWLRHASLVRLARHSAGRRSQRPRTRSHALDPTHAARLEVEWWRLHREHQHDPVVRAEALVASLVDLYSYVYDVPPATVAEAARLRVEAMDHSDAWVAAGCDLADPTLTLERQALVASYTSLRATVG